MWDTPCYSLPLGLTSLTSARVAKCYGSCRYVKSVESGKQLKCLSFLMWIKVDWSICKIFDIWQLGPGVDWLLFPNLNFFNSTSLWSSSILSSQARKLETCNMIDLFGQLLTFLLSPFSEPAHVRELDFWQLQSRCLCQRCPGGELKNIPWTLSSISEARCAGCADPITAQSTWRAVSQMEIVRAPNSIWSDSSLSLLIFNARTSMIRAYARPCSMSTNWAGSEELYNPTTTKIVMLPIIIMAALHRRCLYHSDFSIGALSYSSRALSNPKTPPNYILNITIQKCFWENIATGETALLLLF